MAAGRAPRVAAALLAAGALTACAAAPGPEADAPSAPSTSPRLPSASPAGEPTRQEDAQRQRPERVLVHHATRPQLRLDGATAAAVRAGEVTSWGELGRPGRPLRVVRGLDAVERDRDAVAVVPLDVVRPSVTVASVGGRDPVRSAPDAVSLTVTGDLMLVRGVPDAAAALRPLSSRLRSADLTVGNLESTLSTDGDPTQGSDSFGGDASLRAPLRAAGFDALSLANNHAGDFGDRALRQTVRLLRDSASRPFGAGADLAAASRPLVLERGGVRFAFVGFNAIGETPRAAPDRPGALSVRMPPRTGPLVEADLDRVRGVVRSAAGSADVVVVLPHWGTQYTHRPEPVQRRVAAALARSGADLVVGGHPHWVQGLERAAGTPVVHSLGNFVFDMDFQTKTMEGVLLEATFHGAELKAMRFVPYRMDDDSFAPRVVRGAAARRILGDLWGSSRGPWRR